MVQQSLLAFDSSRYRLFAWVVMPNHIHTLFQPVGDWTVAKIVASWKKFTARKILDAQSSSIPGTPISRLAATCPVWHRDYWDRYIRDKAHFAQAVEYIHMNPVKAALVAHIEDWPWSSAFPGNANLPIGNSTSAPNPK